MDRKTKLMVAGGTLLLLVIALIGIVVSCSKNKAEDLAPSPTPIISVMPELTPTATPLITPKPTATPTSPGIPVLPNVTIVPTATPTTSPSAGVPVLPSGNSTAKPASSPIPITVQAAKAPAFDFGLPAVANVNASIVVQASSVNVTSVNWSLSKNGGSTAINGALTNGGGTISFKESGKYTLSATAANSVGKTVTVKQDIEIFAIGEFAFGLPSMAYTDTVCEVDVLPGAGAIAWNISKDGSAISLTNAYAGTITDTGGYITFRKEGKYTLTGTNASGKIHKADITVYPLLRVPFSTPVTTFRNTDAAVAMGETYLEGQNITWAVERSNEPTEYKGSLSNDGGSVAFAELGTYAITASVSDPKTGRVFSHTRKISVVNQRPNTPEGKATVTNTRLGNKVSVEFEATATDPDGDEVTLEWDGRTQNDGYKVGNHTVRVRAKDSLGDYSDWLSVPFDVPNSPPDAPVANAAIHRDNVVNKQALVTFEATATDPDGDPVTYEWEDWSNGDYYALGAHTVGVRAVDSFGAVSKWTTVPFEITNEAPGKPVISRNPPDNFVLPGNSVNVTALSTDPDGDAVEYIWEGRPAENYAYPEGRVIVRVIARDAFGAESPRTSLMWIMGDPNRAGSLMLTGPGSSISEPGIEDATLVYYRFIVPPVAGHSGNDYGRVRGYNRLTGQWDQLDYGTTSNGISFERTLQAGVYTMLDLYYYTDHACMYGLSNITYVALFEFDEIL